MLRKILQLLILLVIIGALVLGIYYFTSTRNQPTIPGEQKKSFSFKDFLPFGTKKGTLPDTEGGLSGDIPKDIAGSVVETPKKMYPISTRRVVAVAPFQKERFAQDSVATTTSVTSTSKTNKTQTAPVLVYDYGVRLLEKTSGLIFEIMNNNQTVETRISDSVTPALGEGLIGNNGSSLIGRFLRPEDDMTIETFIGSIAGLSSPAKVIGSFLPRDVTSVSISPDTNSYFYLYPVNGGSTGVVATFTGGNKTAIFSSPFAEWTTAWTNQNLITLYPKPSGLVKNYIYTLDVKTSEMKKIIGGFLGLTGTLSPDGKTLAYSYAKAGSSTLIISKPSEMKGKETGLQTFAEKCVFSDDSLYLYCAIPNDIPNGVYPDAWYKGEVQFSDSFWKLDIANQAYYLLVDTTETGDTVDAVSLQLSKDASKLYFINKNDDRPWVVETR